MFEATDFFTLSGFPIEKVHPTFLSALTVNPPTAYRLLNDFVKLEKGDVVIQNAANSMVGLCVAQLAALRGIKTINVVRPRANSVALIERIKKIGGYVVDIDTSLGTHEFSKIISDLPQPKLALNGTGGESATEIARLLA